MLLLITVLSLAVAAFMSLVAWRLARDERRRSDARVAALAEEIHGAPGGLFARPRSAPAAPWLMPLAAVAAAAIVGVAASMVVTRGRAVAPGSQVAPTPAPGAARATLVPLELLALGQERNDGRLTVRGVVRNPIGAVAVERLAVVVFLVDHSGEVVARARAPIEPLTFTPGSESTFAVTATGAASVERYRVSFRTDDRVLAHVDRRERAPTAPAP